MLGVSLDYGFGNEVVASNRIYYKGLFNLRRVTLKNT
jgi:hypothetical protein